jgi:hypothetical protein
MLMIQPRTVHYLLMFDELFERLHYVELLGISNASNYSIERNSACLTRRECMKPRNSLLCMSLSPPYLFL